MERVEIRPRVSGYISQVQFPEGREVKKGDVLFVIDPRPYEAELKRREGAARAGAHPVEPRRARKTRAEKLAASRAISKEEFDSRVASSEQAQRQCERRRKRPSTAAALNVTFTRVEAPISGIVSRAEVTAGNLVNAGQTLLTTIVSIDPIYVEFEGDEQVYLKYTQMDRSRRAQELAQRAQSRVDRPFWTRSVFPHEGVDGVRGQRARPRDRHHSRPGAAR